MRITRAIWIVVLTGAGSAWSAAAQHRMARLTSVSQVSTVPVVTPASRMAAADWNAPAERTLAVGKAPREQNKLRLLEAAFRVEREKTAFLAQTRLPLVHLWDGRIEIACVHQRLREVHTHSALPQADQASVLRADRVPYLRPESRSSYGGGIWLHFGRPRGAERKAI